MKRICSFIVFTTLLLIKVSAFHVYTHHHDDCDSVENCEICDVVFENQTTDFDVLHPIILDSAQWALSKDFSAPSSSIFIDDSKLNRLSCRPPPSY
ncbi:MAG: hypothetical protein AAGD17_12035 [Bacteroidota bacterium]